MITLYYLANTTIKVLNGKGLPVACPLSI